MRYLGIDYGSKRIGLAISDEEGKIAFPHKVIESNPDPFKTIQRIGEITKAQNISTIIIGLPLSFDGKKTQQTITVERFAQVLQGAVQLPVEFQNEILSSRMAEREGIARGNIDSSAAAIILQSYLDSHA